MEGALEIWKEEGLPALRLKRPWYGYELGYWPDEFEEEAQLALKGEHYRTGEKLANRRVYGTSLSGEGGAERAGLPDGWRSQRDAGSRR